MMINNVEELALTSINPIRPSAASSPGSLRRRRLIAIALPIGGR